jgi:hypothetical protein
MRRLPVAVRTAAALALLVLLAGCHTAGPRAVRHARADYNEAMAAGYNEQLLLNLVRLRYRDTPHFLEISSLVTSHVLGATAGASATVGAGDSDVGVSLGGSYEESPTVIYAPLTGEAFVTRLLTPIQIETLYLLMRSGWSVERVLRCCVRQMNGLLNAPGADGPTPAYTPEFRDFAEVAQALRELQVRHLLRLDAVAGAAPAAQAGDGGKDGGNGGGGRELEFFLVLEEPEQVRAALDARQLELLDALAVRPSARGDQRVVPLRAGIVRAAGEDEGDALRLRPRSLMGVLYLLSQGVEVPPEHLEAGLVTLTDPGGEPPAGWSGGCPPQPWSAGLDWPRTVLADLFTVRTSPRRPDDAFVAVRHRGHWFYVPDCDLESKTTFALLVQLFALQSGDPKERASAVVLSLGD